MVVASRVAPLHGRDGLLLGAYAGALMTLALLLFGASFAARLRRAEGAGGRWWLVALVGIATSIGIVGNALEIMFVRAVGHGVTGKALWIGYGADHWLGVWGAQIRFRLGVQACA